MKKTQFLVAIGCGALLGAPIVWACNEASNDASYCSSATTCGGENPQQQNGGGFTCADAKHVNQIYKTCMSTTNNATCNDGYPVDCSQSVHCTYTVQGTNSYCVEGTGYGSWDKATPKTTGSGCY